MRDGTGDGIHEDEGPSSEAARQGRGEGLVDLHTHLLPGVDDGVRTVITGRSARSAQAGRWLPG